MSWDFVLSDLAGNAVSELPGARSKRVSLGVRTLSSAAVTVPTDSDVADFLLGGDALLRVYQSSDTMTSTPPGVTDRKLMAHLRLVTAEEAGQAGQPGTVAATFADPFWTLLRRLIGKSTAGYSRGTALAPVDRGTIISELVAATNAESASGLRMGTVTASSSTYVSGWFYKRIAEAITELTATLDGPDWRIRPIELVPVAGQALGVIGELDVAAAIGVANPDAAFEYGDGLVNVAGYRRLVSLETSLNRAIHLPPGFPDTTTQQAITADDAASQAARGLLEDVIASDVNVDDLRTKLVQYHVAIRKGPRQTMTFSPVRDPSGQRVPRVGIDYNVGDAVPFRVTILKQDGSLSKRINVLTRVYNVDVNVDDVGVGVQTLTVAPT